MPTITPPCTEEAVIIIEQLREQLSLALSVLMSLGFDVFDLASYL